MMHHVGTFGIKVLDKDRWGEAAWNDGLMINEAKGSCTLHVYDL